MEKATRQYNSKNNIFQSTLPRRERRKYSAWQCLYLQFQSTLPRRERRIDRTLNCVRLCYFNPRSREGSDYFFSASSTFCVISIHAPAKGATEVTPSIATLIAISIHAPAKGATYILPPELPSSRFQSTLPRRERRSSNISAVKWSCHFNPRSREGSDEGWNQCIDEITGDFNPRSREGSDFNIQAAEFPEMISIHAPAKGATTYDFGDITYNRISIHAPAKGATAIFHKSSS